MNDDDLERMLRSQEGPRERGYQPRQLTEPAVRQARGGSAVLRVALLASAVGAAALVVAIGAAALLPRGPIGGGVGSGSDAPSSTAVATSSQAAPSAREVTPCAPADVELSAEAWGGAAGSRGTVVTLALRDGRDACTLGHPTGAWLTDAAGATLVESEPLTADAIALVLDAEHRYTVGVAWSNWCGDAVSGSVTVHLRLLGGTELDVAPQGANAAVPPCMGDAATSLSVTGLQPAP